MPALNRRRFLQFASAAGLAPMIPTLPARAAVASGAATSSQMLWASLIARAGNAKSATDLASAMGIPQKSAQGIFAKLAEKKIVAANLSQTLGHTGRPNGLGIKQTPKPAKSKPDLRDMFKEEAEITPEIEGDDAVESVNDKTTERSVNPPETQKVPDKSPT